MKKKNGVSLVIHLKDVHGLAQTGRDFLSKIMLTNFDFDVFDFSATNLEKNDFFEAITTNKSQFEKRIFFDTQYHALSNKHYNYKTLFWEFESGMLEFKPDLFKDVDEVLAFSDFTYNYFNKVAPPEVKITKMKYPFSKNWKITSDKKAVREKYGIKESDFVCFFNFDYKSSYNRKNPEASLKAFKAALGKYKNTKFMLKTIGFEDLGEKVKLLEKCVKELDLSDKIIFINEYMSRNETISLMNACDCYISLHRGEGFGMGLAEAMSLAKPAIATNYSGNTEFMKPEFSLLVDYKIVDANDDSESYKSVKKWAEPNIETAAKYLEKLYKDPSFAKDLGEKAQKFLEEYYSLDDFKSEIEKVFGIKEGKNKAKCLSQKKKKIYMTAKIFRLAKKVFS